MNPIPPALIRVASYRLRVLALALTVVPLLSPRASGDEPPATAYSEWQQQKFPAAYGNPALEASVWGDLADPDGDGCKNLLEFVSLRNPALADAHLGAQCRLDGGDLVVTYREITSAAPGVTWRGEWSVDSAFWVVAGVRYQTIETNSDYRVVEARISRNRETKVLFRLVAHR